MFSSATRWAICIGRAGLAFAICVTGAGGRGASTQPTGAAAPSAPATAAASPGSRPTDSQPVASAPVPSTPSPMAAATQSSPASEPDVAGMAGLEVRNGDVVVFLGDDLTDTPRPTTTNSFPLLVETFLTARYPGLSAHYINVGWSGDTVARALLRLDRDVLSHRPTIVVVCLGLNDAEYLPGSDQRLASYRKDLLRLVEKCRKAAARLWLISPPSVEEEKGRKVRIQRSGRPGMTDLQAIDYNAVLARYAAACGEVARETDSGFVDWFTETIAARSRGRQADPDFSLTTNGLNPNDRAHAMAAAGLLKAWGARAIEVVIDLSWVSGEARVSSHLPTAKVVQAEINASGERRIALADLPLPWPMAGGQAGFLAPNWEAAALCRFMLRVPDAPERGVRIRLEWPQGPVDRDEPISASQLHDGFNLACSEALNAANEITELFQLIGTKNYYHYGTWRKLALAPPREAELVEAHRKLIEAWNSYVAGTERIIQNQPKTFDLQLVLSEAVPIERLPTSSPQQPPRGGLGTSPAPTPPERATPTATETVPASASLPG